MDTIWLQISQDGITYTTISTPSSYALDIEDLDNDSYRSVVDGSLQRNRISKNWVKLSLAWNAILASEVAPILTAAKNNQKIYVKCNAPELANTQIEFMAYCSKAKSETIEENANYRRVSFNIIQSDPSDFN